MRSFDPIRPGFAVLAASLWAAAAFAGEAGPDLRMTLVSEERAIRPGKPFTVGLNLVHGPGWHTYWENPGIVGVPTSLEWDLPEGFQAGPIQWPAPMIVPMATVKAYGYEDEATLLVEITPPAELPAGETIRLAAKVVYMACATTCHPGFEDIDLELPVAKDPEANPSWDPQWRDVFETTRASFPVALKGWSCEAVQDGERIRLKLVPAKGSKKANRRVSEGYFFSLDGQVNSDEPQRVRRLDGGGLEFELATSFYGPEDTEGLEGVLYSEEGWHAGGKAKATHVRVPWPAVRK